MKRRTRRCLCLAVLSLTLFTRTAAAADYWRPFALTGFWGQVGAGYAVDYEQSPATETWSAGFEKALRGILAGFVLHPRFVSWQGDLDLVFGRTVRNRTSSVRLDILPEHSVSTSVMGQRTSGQESRDFLPVREVATESLDATTLIGAYGEPLILNWSVTDSETVDSEQPVHRITRRGKATYDRKLHRDHDFAGRYEQIRVYDYLKDQDAQRESLSARVKSRFLYDLITLDSKYLRTSETGLRDESVELLSEELTLSHRKNLDTTLRVDARNEVLRGELGSRMTTAAETAWRLDNGLSLRLGGSQEYGWIPGLQSWASKTLAGVNWGGDIGVFKTQVYGRYVAGPERSEGGRGVWARGERLTLSNDPQQLTHPEVDAGSVRVYLVDGLDELDPETDFEVLPEPGGASTLIWRRPGSDFPEGTEILVDYRYLLRKADSHKAEASYGASLTAGAPRMTLTVATNSGLAREETVGEDPREVRTAGHSANYTFIDGRVKLTANITERDALSHRQASVQFTPEPWTLSQTVTHTSTEAWTRSTKLTRAAYKLTGGEKARLEAVVEDRSGEGRGVNATEEHALQAGLTVSCVPDPSFWADGSIRYVKDWMRPDREQVALKAESGWQRGQLALNLEAELRQDLGRHGARGRLSLSAVRYF